MIGGLEAQKNNGAYVVRDSFSFVNSLLSLNLNSSNITMANYDVTSLFNNIPVDDTIEITCDHLFSDA